MSRGGEVSGSGAKLTSTKLSGSIRATLTYSRSTRSPISNLRRFPEALRKFDQVLDITPDDVDTIATKAANSHKSEGDLQRAVGADYAAASLSADHTASLEQQVYQDDPGAPPSTNDHSVKGSIG